MPDGKIVGLPNKADNLLNKAKDNTKIDRMMEALVDMGALDGRLPPQSSGNMYSDMYKYQFKKVL